ncbi:glycosyltransferase family 4 protein [Bosea sp. BH3]|uniref:glycosyltransferase family 4 protein n=1 Tax=Bosea sp. BH3 TaxID=2871701 RepID=UPI0021CB0773|nr:glycosyltransferase family 4 protein [Bosea sp. BH3]MCU4180123.1 glycosyltransferase family 4 protein [Bosea sp. BH3]
MRIGIIAHLKHAIREPFAGGLEMHTSMLQSALQRRGHEVTVFASSHSEPEACVEAICDETSLTEVGCDEAPDKVFFQEHHAYLSLMNGLRHRGFDVIHNNSLHYLPVAMADALPTPMVTTLHTPPFAWLESGVRLCKAPHATFVAVSESIRRTWSKVAPIDHVIMNGIDLDRFCFKAHPADEPYWVWCGRIVPEKGLHHAIAAAGLSGATLLIAGPISDQDYFDREIAPRLDERVRYLGHLPHSELATVIGGAQIFLCTPCWEEPYGLVVAEALACGVPVAAFARGAIPELLDTATGVLAVPDDPASLAQAGIAAQKLDRQACRTHAEQRCDASRMIDEYEALYASLIEASSETKFAA